MANQYDEGVSGTFRKKYEFTVHSDDYYRICGGNQRKDNDKPEQLCIGSVLY